MIPITWPNERLAPRPPHVQVRAMRLTGAAASLLAFFTPALALACPSANTACGAHACGFQFGGYVTAVGFGLLAGMGSIAVERATKRRLKKK